MNNQQISPIRTFSGSLKTPTPKYQLTPLGKKMARLPLDPKISRILLAAQKHDCMAEMLIIVSALSIQDPRERPLEVRDLANKAHERFADKQSDFLTYLNIWDSFQRERDKKLSNKQLIQWCHQYFLSHLRMREWRELYTQLVETVVEMGLASKEQTFRQPENLSLFEQSELSDNLDLSAKLKQKQLDKKNHRANVQAKKQASYEQIHRALLTGLVANVGQKLPDANDYIGVRGSHFHLFPASNLFKSKPKWVLAAELTETSKLYARDVASIQPEWIEQETPHLVRYHYFEPHWERKRGEVVASERVTLYGLTVLPRRAVAYGRVAPDEARELFIRGALVAQECDLQAAFFVHNKKLIKEVIDLENKSRKQDILIDDEILFDFYHRRLPEKLPNGKPLADIRTFETWLKHTDTETINSLFLNKEDLMQHAAAHVTEEQFPKFWKTADGKFKLLYRFEPHHPMDGVTLIVPLTVLNRINPHQLEWLVQGMIREKLQLLIKALPKQIRRVCVPVPEFITQFLLSEPDTSAPILPQLAHAIAKHAGDMRLLEQIDLNEWAAFRLPEHCYFNLKIVDDGGQELAMGRDLIQIQQQLGKSASLTFRDNTQEFERENITVWDIGTLPESIKFARGKQQLVGYLGLQKEKDGKIALRLFDTNDMAQAAHRQGVIELMKLQLKEQVKDLNKGLLNFTQIAMQLKQIGVDTLREDITQAVCDRAFIGEDELPRNEKDFKEQVKRARSRLPAVKEALNKHLLEVANQYAVLVNMMGKHPLNYTLKQQLEKLIYPQFVSQTPWQQWQRLPIYLQAMQKRMEKYSANSTRDKMREDDIQELEMAWTERVQAAKMQNQAVSDKLAGFFWSIQELRVSLFAQELRTPSPVSVKRLLKEWEGIIN
ncbi:DUF3418 domain-containing protein [Simonsiella muelleri]|uniref:ATP-dependent helicase HrpA n=1 Tax=Simonsiella muelleri ATCC 29453 TaxID=641147 RepID=V9HKA7_9NEIS|nr:DUF3418 domain-containing protein [Simonsiella muelleri]AUX60937.1 ATP-dependent helicase [Simonsiella muelleri ATCC 29453]EFG30284.1 ATP-dependent helicase HrpA [Simonsiella muelleri ATCC 29453]UBQ52978.1 DUF3418 domain-containing protein [Simonsiella muelleri]